MLAKPTNQQLAERWQCSIRTIQRARHRGVDTRDPLAVARHFAALRNPSLATLERAVSLLGDELPPCSPTI